MPSVEECSYLLFCGAYLHFHLILTEILGILMIYISTTIGFVALVSVGSS